MLSILQNLARLYETFPFGNFLFAQCSCLFEVGVQSRGGGGLLVRFVQNIQRQNKSASSFELKEKSIQP